MARRDFQSTVVDALPRIIREQAKNTTGSIKFTQKDRKTVGKVYVKEGNIYALEMTSYVPKIVNRIVTNEYIKDGDREQVIQQFGDDVTNMNVVNFVVKYQLFPEKPLVTYLKDYFFDAFDELYHWVEVTAEWRAKEEAPATAFRIPPVSPDNIFEKLHEREVCLRDEVSREWAVHPKDLDEVQYRKNFQYTDPDYTNMLILSLVDTDEFPIGYVADYLGIPHFNAKLALYNLWKTGAVDVFNPSGIWYSSRSDEEISKTEKKANGAKTVAVQQKELIEEFPVEETFVVEVEQEVVEEFYAPATAPVSELAQQKPDEIPFLNSVSPPVGQLKETVDINRGAVEPDYDVDIYLLDDENVGVVEPTVGTVDSSKYPIIETVKPTIEENFMSESGKMSAASQLRALKEQLKQELEALQQKISATTNIVNTKTQYIQGLHSDRAVLVGKLREIDGQITSETSILNTAKDELLRLQEEYNDSKDLL